MKIIVCGAREWHHEATMRDFLEQLPKGTVVIEGGANGADKMAGRLATHLGFTVQSYPAEWARYGRAAGMIRNQQMLDLGPDEVHGFHDHLELSRGTRDMLIRASKAGIPCWLHKSDGTVKTCRTRSSQEEQMPKVRNRRSWKGTGAYVGRPSKWGNPFEIGHHGTREEVIAKYRAWIITQPQLLAALPELAGQDLVCWCAPLACHADVLLEMANQQSQSKDRRHQ